MATPFRTLNFSFSIANISIIGLIIKTIPVVIYFSMLVSKKVIVEMSKGNNENPNNNIQVIYVNILLSEILTILEKHKFIKNTSELK